MLGFNLLEPVSNSPTVWYGISCGDRPNVPSAKSLEKNGSTGQNAGCGWDIHGWLVPPSSTLQYPMPLARIRNITISRCGRILTLISPSIRSCHRSCSTRALPICSNATTFHDAHFETKDSSHNTTTHHASQETQSHGICIHRAKQACHSFIDQSSRPSRPNTIHGIIRGRSRRCRNCKIQVQNIWIQKHESSLKRHQQNRRHEEVYSQHGSRRNVKTQ